MLKMHYKSVYIAVSICNNNKEEGVGGMGRSRRYGRGSREERDEEMTSIDYNT